MSGAPPDDPIGRAAAACGSALFWAFITVSSFLLFPIAVTIWALTLPFDPRKRLLHQFTCFWASLYTWLNPVWSVRIEGAERLREPVPVVPGTHPDACVMVANHLSLLDILVLLRLFTHYKWVSKIENFRVPFIGWNMSLNEYIPLKRGDKRSIIEMMRRCEETLAQGSPVMIFPEGTRSADGQLRPFRAGAFELALKARVPIRPMIIEGSHEALPKRGFVLQGRHDIRVTVLDPIPYEHFEELDPEELRDRVRDLIASELEAADKRRETAGASSRAPA